MSSKTGLNFGQTSRLPRSTAEPAAAAPGLRAPAAAPQRAQAASLKQFKASLRQLLQGQRVAQLLSGLGSNAPVQLVPAGRYITTEDAHLRDLQKREIAEIKAGSEARVGLHAPTSRFKLGVFSFAKDHTWAHVNAQQGWMRDDALGQAQAEAMPSREDEREERKQPVRGRDAATASSAFSEPLNIGPARGRAPARRVRGGSLQELGEDLPELQPIAVADAKVQAFEALHLYVHFTKEEYRPAIHEQGLKAGASKGIGLPTDMGSSGDNEPDPSHVYVLSGSLSATTSAVSGEAGGAAVAVLSRHASRDKDMNYRGGAYRFGEAIPTSRHYQRSRPSATISLVLPLTPTAKAGLAEFINEGAPQLGNPVTPDEAEVLLAAKLFARFPAHFYAYRNLAPDSEY